VVRLGAMGDILHALPAVTALRHMHPGWIIDWVVEPRWQALLSAKPNPEGGAGFNPRIEPAASPRASAPEAQPLVDQLHLAPTRQWRSAPLSRKTIHEISSLRHALKAASYDTVLDLQGAIRSAVLARMAGSQRLIGDHNPRERAARLFYSERVSTQSAHVIDQAVELARAVAGDDLHPLPPCLPIDPAAEAWADAILPRPSSPPAVLINPGAGWGAKRWPVERYTAVARELIRSGVRVMVNTGPGEEPLAQAMAAGTDGAATPVACSLAQLIALTRRISLVIAGDTGPLHLACALGRPVVGIYGPTDPSRNGPYGVPFRVLRSSESRRDHTRHAAPEAGLLTIQPDAVLHAANELLAAEASQ